MQALARLNGGVIPAYAGIHSLSAPPTQPVIPA